MELTINSNKWYDITVTMPSSNEDTCVDEILSDLWYTEDTEPFKGYITLFADRFPGVSRDYQDDGYYIRILGKPDEPMAVAIWDWSHCSCYEWDHYLKLPDRVHKFSSYIRLSANDCLNDPEHYLCKLNMHEIFDNNSNDDEKYAYWKIAKSLLSLKCTKLV